MTGRDDRPAVRQPLVAAPRDASWYARPDIHRVKVLHIATTVWTGACQPGPEHQFGTIPLDDTLQSDASEVYDDLRCRRPGCRVWWAQVPSKPRPGVRP